MGIQHGCGRAAVQGRGLFQHRHIAHPTSPPPFLLPSHNGGCILRMVSFFKGCPHPLGIVLPTPNIPSPGSVPESQYVGQWYRTGLLKAAMESVPGVIDPRRRQRRGGRGT